MLFQVTRLLSPSFVISTEKHRFLFNVPAGTQRACTEHQIRLAKKCHHIFLTSVDLDTVAGLPGLILTLSDATADDDNSSLTLHGPSPLTKDYLYATRHFMKNKSDFVKTNEHHGNGSSFDWSNDEIFIKSIPMTRKKRKLSEEQNCTVLSYLLLSPEVPRKFNVKKARALNIPPGPLYKALASGQSITLDDDTIITPDMVMDSTDPSVCGKRQAVLVLTVPSIEYLRGSTASLSDVASSNVKLILHIVPTDVQSSVEYQEFISTTFKSCNEPDHHWYLNENKTPYSIASTKLVNTLHQVCPIFFPTALKVEDSDFLEKFTLIPTKSKGVILPPKHDVSAFEIPSDDITLPLMDALNKETENDDLTVTFLGTGSAIPSKYRNVSSTLVTLSKSSSIMFDAGEGTLQQWQRLYTGEDDDRFQNALESLEIIFISHNHADHHLGLLEILRESPNVITVIAPMAVHAFVQEVLSLQSSSSSSNITYDFINISDFQTSNSVKYLTNITAVPVVHCHEAYALVVSTKNKKIVFSGDCRPCPALVSVGHKADILIHEATFENDMKTEAISKKHCTIEETIEIGTKMEACDILLTHFSQRYPKFPSNIEPKRSKVWIAFDLMVWRRTTKTYDSIELNTILSKVLDSTSNVLQQ